MQPLTILVTSALDPSASPLSYFYVILCPTHLFYAYHLIARRIIFHVILIQFTEPLFEKDKEQEQRSRSVSKRGRTVCHEQSCKLANNDIDDDGATSAAETQRSPDSQEEVAELLSADEVGK